MWKRILAVAFIFICTSIAWAILGGTILSRSNGSSNILRGRVTSIWGMPQDAVAPYATYNEPVEKKVTNTTNGKVTDSVEWDFKAMPLPLDYSKIDVAVDLQHRQKGLIWYSTYGVKFTGDYVFTNDTDKDRNVTLVLKFPAEQAIYDDLQFIINGQPARVGNGSGSVMGVTRIAAGKTASLHVGYRSQGLDRWSYNFGGNVSQVRDFSLTAHTNFTDIDFAENTLSPSEKHATPGGWQLNWTYKNLVSGYQISLVMPEKLQPGPLAGEISFFAPVSLFFFFFIMLVITTLRRIDLHPMNYFFLAAAFFAFHLLMAYLVDHISIHLAFAICSAVSIFLVVSYLRLVVGLRFAALEAGGAQFLYLVLFSYAFFFKGFTGLAITIGAILTLFGVMQLTGRIQWSTVGTRPAEPLAPVAP